MQSNWQREPQNDIERCRTSYSRTSHQSNVGRGSGNNMHTGGSGNNMHTGGSGNNMHTGGSGNNMHTGGGWYDNEGSGDVGTPPPPPGPGSSPQQGGSNQGTSSSGTTTTGASEELVSRTLFLCKLPQITSEEAIQAAFSQYGEVRKVAYYQDKGIAFVEFWDIRHAELARSKLSKGVVLDNRVCSDVKVQFSRIRDGKQNDNTGTIYVRPREKGQIDLNSKDLYRNLFEQFGAIKAITANRKRESEKFIEFYDLRAAQRALSMSGYPFNGVTLEVQMSRNQSKTYNNSFANGPEGAPRPSKFAKDPFTRPLDASYTNYGKYIDLLFTGANVMDGHTAPINYADRSAAENRPRGY